MRRLLCDFCHRAAVNQVLGIPHCYQHLVDALEQAEVEALDLSA